SFVFESSSFYCTTGVNFLFLTSPIYMLTSYDIFFLNKCFVLQEPYLSKNGNMIYKSQSASDTQVQNY
ncbi:hypothetical protein KTQ89_12795, partial [Holdemanella porci]|uniref:hypothetical protein n=1 Tax=Holdemanella porci TaxID=2652276 RepID=UPI001C2B8C77